MKPILLLLCGALCTALTATAQKVVITKYQDTTISQFYQDGEITSGQMNEGFQLHNNIPEGKDIAITIKNAGDNWVLLPAIDSNTTGNIHFIKGPYEHNGVIELQLAKPKKKPVLVHLQVTNNNHFADTKNEVDLTRILKDTCDSTPNQTIMQLGPGCQPADAAHPFGEDPNTYTDNTVTYIYDFNPEPSKRRFYKIWKNEDGILQKAPVNLNTETLNPTSDAWLKVVHVNRYLYEIVYNGRVVRYESEPNILFTRLFTGDSELLGGLLNVFTTTVTNALQARKDSLQGRPNTLFEELLTRIRCYLRTYNAVQQRMLAAYKPCVDFPCCSNNEIISYYDLANRLLDIRILAGSLQNTINERKETVKTLTEQQAACTKAATDLQALEKEKKELDKKTAGGGTLRDEEKARLAALPALISEAKENTCSKEKRGEVDANLAAATRELKELSAVGDLLAKLPSEDDLKRVVVFINNMVNQNGEEVFPLSTGGNQFSLSLQVKSKDSVFKIFSLPPYTGPVMTYDLPVIKKLLVSFSSGFFVGNPDYLQNKTYQWQQLANGSGRVSDTAQYRLVETGYSLPPLGFAALGNLGWKLTRNAGLGVSLGVGITIEKNPRPAYLLGGSAFFGNERQFVLTIGAAGMSINRLQNNWQAAAEQKILYAVPPPVDYYKEFRVGAFISFTYTPFTLK